MHLQKCLVLTEVLQIYLGKFSSHPVPAEEIPSKSWSLYGNVRKIQVEKEIIIAIYIYIYI